MIQAFVVIWNGTSSIPCIDYKIVLIDTSYLSNNNVNNNMSHIIILTFTVFITGQKTGVERLNDFAQGYSC